MSRRDMSVIRDTYAALQRAQHEREKLNKQTDRRLADKVLEHYAERHDWSDEDTLTVRMALGLLLGEEKDELD